MAFANFAAWDAAPEPGDMHGRSNSPESFFSNRVILSAWIRHWAHRDTMRFFVSGSTHIPLMVHARIRGMVREWASPTNEYQWCAPSLTPSPTHSLNQFASALSDNDEWDLVRIEHCAIESDQWRAFMHACHAHGWRAFSDPTMRIGTVAFSDDFQAYFDSLPGDFRRELRRRERQLNEHAQPLRARISDGSTSLKEDLQEGFALEALGWKGREKTAVLDSPAVFAYFHDLAKAAASYGALRLVFLYAGDALISFEYYLLHGDQSFLLKTAYHEGYKKYAPGQLGIKKAMEALHLQGIRHYNFFGQFVPWHAPWQPHVTQYGRIIIAKPSIRGCIGCMPWYARRFMKQLRTLVTHNERRDNAAVSY